MLIILQNQVEYIVTQPLLIRDCMIPGLATYANAVNPWWSAGPAANNPINSTDVGFSIQIDNSIVPLSHIPVHFFTHNTSANPASLIKKWLPLYWIIKPDTRLLLTVDSASLYATNQIQPQLYMRGYTLREDAVEHSILPKYIHSNQITHVYSAGTGFNSSVYFGTDTFMIGFSICRFVSDAITPTNILLSDLPTDIPPTEPVSPVFNITEVRPDGTTLSMTNQQNFRFAYGPYDGQFGRINFFHRKMQRGQSLYLNVSGVIAPLPPWNIGDWYSLIVYCLDRDDIEALISQPHLHRYLYPLFPSENIAYEMIQAIQEGVCRT